LSKQILPQGHLPTINHVDYAVIEPELLQHESGNKVSELWYCIGLYSQRKISVEENVEIF